MCVVLEFESQGCNGLEDVRVDGKPQAIVLHEVIPNEGDSIMIVNCGDHYEMRGHSWGPPSLTLTDEDIEDLKTGKMTFN